MKIQAPLPEKPKTSVPQGGHLSVKDKEQIMFIFETLGGMHNQKTVERVYLENKRDPETTMDLFLTGAI